MEPNYKEALRIVAQALAWHCFVECRSFGEDVPLLKPAEANTYAKFVLDMGAATQQMKGNTVEDYKNYYNKKNVQPLRPYVPGEDMSGIYVNPVDTVEEGGMIACLSYNPVAKWYITREFFEANYVEAEQAA